MNDLQILIVTFFLGGVTYFVVRYLGRIFKHAAVTSKFSSETADLPKEKKKNESSIGTKTIDGTNGKAINNTGGGAKKGNKHYGKDKPPTFSHPWLLTSLKGHSGRVLDFSLSENGKFLATCAEDRSVLIWFVKDFSNKEHKNVRVNIPFDHATKIKWSPDSKAFLVHCATSNQLQVHKLTKKPEDGSYVATTALTFDALHKNSSSDTIGMDMSTNGKFIMTCTNQNELVLYDIRGEVLTRVDTCQMTTFAAKISPCGRFVATSGFTPDVKVWDVKFSRSGDFEKMSRAFELTGHKSGVYDFDFNVNSSLVATLSKDGKFRIFSINIDYKIGQDPAQVVEGDVEVADGNSKISLSGDGRVVAISHRSDIYLYSGLSGEIIQKIEAIHTDAITALSFDAESRWLLTSGDKHIRVFHNVPGFKLTVQDLKEKLKQSTTEGMKDRLRQQIEVAQQQIKKN